MTAVIRKRQALGLSKEAFIYLQGRMYKERIGKDLTERQIAMYERNFEQFQHNGYKQCMDGSLGGAENGRWISWNCARMREILDEQGLDYIELGEVESIDISL